MSAQNRDDDEYSKKARAERIERITAKAHAVGWVAASGSIIYYTKLFDRVANDPNISTLYLALAIFSFSVVFTIMLYLSVWLPVVKKITLPWEIYCPNLIPTATFFGVATLILLNIALWSVYGFLTPLIVFTLFMGILFSTHLIPYPF